MLKVLVTGANGFVGKLLCEELVGRGYDVHALIRGDANTLPSSVRHIQYSDLVKLSNFKNYFKDCYAVIHLAAKVHVKDSRNIAEYRYVNTDGTIHLADLASSQGVSKFIYLSTIKVNGDGEADSSYSHESPVQPVDAYAVSKWEAEQALMEIHASSPMDVTILRPVLMYGAGAKGNLHSLMKVIAAGIPLPLGKIENSRSLLNVRNLNDLICKCMVSTNASGRMFLVSDGYDISTTKLIKLISSSMGKSSKLFSIPAFFMKLATRLIGKSDIYERLYGSLRVDIEDTKKVLNWCPPYSIQEGMREMVSAFKNKST